MKRLLFITALTSGLLLGVGPTAMAAPAGAPAPIDGEGTFRCGSATDGFDVAAVVTGKSKEIVGPRGTSIITSPGLKVTLTANGQTLNYVLTGVVFRTVLSDRIEYVATGRNLITVPDVGLFLTVGNIDYANTLEDKELRRFTGVGRVTDVCALLS